MSAAANPSRTPRRPLREAAVRVVQLLQDHGHVAYFAGGCVRDELLGIEPKDFDVATDARPDRVATIFDRTRSVGESFGVMLVRLYGHSVEVATFRAEWGYTDRRRPDRVEFTDAEHDAKRRDFTINGLFEDPIANRVIDFVGGEADLRAGVIRAIGDATERLNEDHLRALRAVRFAARFDFRIEDATRDAIRADAARLEGVSRERIGAEIEMMLTHPARARAVELLGELGLDGPALHDPATDASSTATLRSLPSDADHALALAAWAIDRGVDRRNVAARWRRSLVLSNRVERDFESLLRLESRFRENWKTLGVAARKRLAARRRFDEALILLAASDPSLAKTIRRNRDELAATPSGINPKPYLTGDDLIQAGLTPGPRFRPVLDAVYDAQLEDRVESRAAALDMARRLEATEKGGGGVTGDDSRTSK
ncbi:MAG: CCA tRNA nucleotidyltransferase [Phycisphaerales bacterium]